MLNKIYSKIGLPTSCTFAMVSKRKRWKRPKFGSNGCSNNHPCLLLGQVAAAAADTTVSGAAAADSTTVAVATTAANSFAAAYC
jgi:hypothetical protein